VELLEQLEAWHIVISISSALVGIGLTVFGKGFTAWSGRLDNFAERVDRRLGEMDDSSKRRWLEVEKKMTAHEDRLHALHVQVEKRVTFLEAKLNGRNNGP